MRECRQNEKIFRANAHANSLKEKDMTSFWKKGIKRASNARVLPASMADNCIVEKGISDMSIELFWILDCK